MTYQEALDFLHGIPRFGKKPGLRRIRRLLERMGNPQDTLRFIHVAGTNGKGSTCAMVSRVLARAGYRTGLYISPFVLDFRERIQVDGEMIAPQDLVQSTALVKSHWDALNAEGEPPSEFETLLAVAMDYFQRRRVDVVVLEVGMGGRFDATNVIQTPVVSVITSLGLDHTEYLGDTIQQIAMEKCGIIKPGGVTVCYPRQDPKALEVVRRRCAEENNLLILPKQAQVLSMDFFGTRMVYDGLELTVPLVGAHQVLNASVAIETLRAAGKRGLPVADEDIVSGIGQVSFPARLEVLGRKPYIVLDGAHNPSGAQVLGEALKLLEGRNIHAVMGMLGNKDVSGSLQFILPYCKSLCAVPVVGNPLSLPAEKLAEIARPLCPRVEVWQEPAEGVRAALARCGPEDVLLVCGSLYLASYLRPLLTELGACANQS